jgi:hypothetical protein
MKEHIMAWSDEERNRFRDEERERARIRGEVRREQYPQLFTVAGGWALALITLALMAGGR